MKIAVLVPFYGRHAITRVVMRHYARMAERRGDLALVAVGSEAGVSRDLAIDNGWLYVEAPNRPLSDKLATGLALCRELAPEAGLLAMGSDDLVTEPWLDRCAASDRMLGLLDLYHVRRASWEMVHWRGYIGARQGESVGAHRFIPTAMLDGTDWKLWPPGLNRNLDSGLYAALGVERRGDPRVLNLTMEAAGCVALGIASESNLTPWRHIVAGADHVEPETVLAKFPEATRADIVALNPAAAAAPRPALPDPLPEFLARRERHEPVRISLVMRAKNAETTIERAIRGALPVVDEVVVLVDDRTTDGTIAVVERLGGRCELAPWKGYGAANNAARALAVGEWHLLVDADEEFEPGNFLEAVVEADQRNADAIHASLLAETGGGTVPQLQIRALRAGRGRWVYKRHNDLRDVGSSVVSSAVVRQSYVGVAQSRASAAIPDLLDMWENPSETTVPPDEERLHASCFLAQAYRGLGDWPKVEHWAGWCIERDTRKLYPQAAAWWCMARMIQNPNGGLADIEAMIAKYPGFAWLEYLAASQHFARWYVNSLMPGRWANRPQEPMAHLPNYHAAAEMLGFVVTAREPTPEELAAMSRGVDSSPGGAT